MQIKKPLRFVSETHSVYWEVRRHFEGRKIQLPDEWESLVAMACFPSQVIEQPMWSGKLSINHPNPRVTLLASEVRAFQKCFAGNPDLTLDIMTFARNRVARYDEKKCKTQDDCARTFFLKYGQGVIIKEHGQLRLPKKGEWDGWKNSELLHRKRNGIKLVPVSKLQDNEVADVLTRHFSKGNSKITITTNSVSHARRYVSYNQNVNSK